MTMHCPRAKLCKDKHGAAHRKKVDTPPLVGCCRPPALYAVVYMNESSNLEGHRMHLHTARMQLHTRNREWK